MSFVVACMRFSPLDSLSSNLKLPLESDCAVSILLLFIYKIIVLFFSDEPEMIRVALLVAWGRGPKAGGGIYPT